MLFRVFCVLPWFSIFVFQGVSGAKAINKKYTENAKFFTEGCGFPHELRTPVGRNTKCKELVGKKQEHRNGAGIFLEMQPVLDI